VLRCCGVAVLRCCVVVQANAYKIVESLVIFLQCEKNTRETTTVLSDYFSLTSGNKQVVDNIAGMESPNLKVPENEFEFLSAEQETPKKETCSCCPVLIPTTSKFEIVQTISSGKDNRINVVLPSAFVIPPKQKCLQPVELTIRCTNLSVCYSADLVTTQDELPEEPMCFSLKSNFFDCLTEELVEKGFFNEARHYDFAAGCYVTHPTPLLLTDGKTGRDYYHNYSKQYTILDRTDTLIVEIVPLTDAYFTPFDIVLTFQLDMTICKMKKLEDDTYLGC